MIDVARLRKSFGARVVLDEVTFLVPEGEAMALVGANSSGKTVLLRVLATLLAADQGEVRIGGISVEDDPGPVRATIGWMPEVWGVHPGVTVAEDLAFHAGLHGFDPQRRATVADELLELVGLADRAGEEADRLTRGQRQRLGLARALVHDPAVLLLDDPLGLDVHAQDELAALVGELRLMGKTLVVSGHQLPELEEICTWVGVLHDGAMVAAGPIAEVRGDAPLLKEAVLRLTDGSGDPDSAPAQSASSDQPESHGPSPDADPESAPAQSESSDQPESHGLSPDDDREDGA